MQMRWGQLPSARPREAGRIGGEGKALQLDKPCKGDPRGLEKDAAYVLKSNVEFHSAASRACRSSRSHG